MTTLITTEGLPAVRHVNPWGRSDHCGLRVAAQRCRRGFDHHCANIIGVEPHATWPSVGRVLPASRVAKTTCEGECALVLDHIHVTVQKSAVLVLDKDFARHRRMRPLHSLLVIGTHATVHGRRVVVDHHRAWGEAWVQAEVDHRVVHAHEALQQNESNTTSTG